MIENHDIGEKIGGAKKDYYRTIADYYEENEVVDKGKVFPRYNYAKLKEKNDLTALETYYIKKVYESIPGLTKNQERIKEFGDVYINVCNELKNEVNKYLEMSHEERKQCIDENTVYKNALSNANIIKDENFNWGSDELSSFQKIINRKMTMLTTREVYKDFHLEKGLETDYEFADRHMYVLKIADSRIPGEDKQDQAYIKDGQVLVSPKYSSSMVCIDLPADGSKPEYVFYNDLTSSAILCETKEQAELKKQLFLKVYDNMQQGKEKETKSKPARKTAFKESIIADVDRVGPTILNGKDATDADYLEKLKLRAVEFGNNLNSGEKWQLTKNSGYEALVDLAEALEIKPEDVSLGGKLAIAYASRGHGSAAAHYEPLKNVINLTRNRGAGSLAHEWAHALDYALADKYYHTTKLQALSEMFKDEFGMHDLVETMRYKTETYHNPKALNWDRTTQRVERMWNIRFSCEGAEKSREFRRNGVTNNMIKECLFADLEDARKNRNTTVEYTKTREMLAQHNCNADWSLDFLRDNFKDNPDFRQNIMDDPYTTGRVDTDFYKESKKMDKMYSKAGHGYWQSEVEMFARAFACYVDDKLKEKGIKSPYLSGSAYSSPAIPKGKEKEAIYEKIDTLIANIKEKGFVRDNHRYAEHLFENGELYIDTMLIDDWKENISSNLETMSLKEACDKYAKDNNIETADFLYDYLEAEEKER